MLTASESLLNFFDIPHGLFYVLLGAVIIMSILSFIFFYFDSKKPIGANNRISVSSATLYTVLFGSFGTLIAILALNYQIKRKYFLILASVCSIIYLVTLILIF